MAKAMELAATDVVAQAQAARRALPALAALRAVEKETLLMELADLLRSREAEILAANAEDMAAAQEAGLSAPLLRRLKVDGGKVRQMATHVEEVARLPDPVGEIDGFQLRPNGLRIGRMRVPIGLLGVIYESRPDVTVDAAALSLKTGNAVLLRGGNEAARTNLALVAAIDEVVRRRAGLEGAVQLVVDPDRTQVERMLRLTGVIDLLVPRGGAGLIRRVVEEARVPVLETGVGNCHTFVHRDADLEMAVRVAVNAKVSNCAVCNAMETLLVDAPVAGAFLPRIGRELAAYGVELRACERALPHLQGVGAKVVPAQEEDWATEYLDLILAVRVVDGLDEAIAHIERFGTRHSEAIITENWTAAWTFLQRVDAAAVYVNASTRFTDGYEFGLGAEMGISTQKLHARGPVGLRELTTTKYVVLGSGQVRG